MAEPTPTSIERKRCPKCPDGQQVKPVGDFYAFSNGRLSGYCKLCTREANRKSYRRTSDRQGRSTVPATIPVVGGRKHCTSCDESKPLSEFYPHGTGHRRVCKSCQLSAYRERYAQDAAYRDEVAKRKSEAYRNSEKAKLVEAARAARAALDPEAERLRRLKDAREWATRHRAANLEHAREIGRRAASRRRARKRGLPSEKYTMSQLIERDGTRCVLCHGELDLSVGHPELLAPTVEHLECFDWPECPGDILTNVAISHWDCNNRRRTRPHPAAARKRSELLAAEAQLA